MIIVIIMVLEFIFVCIKLVFKEGNIEYFFKVLYICEEIFVFLEVVYDYDLICCYVMREIIEVGFNFIWCYCVFLFVIGKDVIDVGIGMIFLVKFYCLVCCLGLKNFYIKNDVVNMFILSFKDWVVFVVLIRVWELGFIIVFCVSIGNLVNFIVAIVVYVGLDCCVFILVDLEVGKVLGILIYNFILMVVKGNYD